MITRGRLLELLEYNPLTGVFLWKRLGREAGSVHKSGYRYLKIDGQMQLAHRMAWLIVHNHLPPEIDHKNLRKDDNRIENLRLATRFEQMANTPTLSSNSSGHRGVNKVRGRWQARITVKGNRIFLGEFDSPEEAGIAYQLASVKMRGEFHAAIY